MTVNFIGDYWDLLAFGGVFFTGVPLLRLRTGLVVFLGWCRYVWTTSVSGLQIFGDDTKIFSPLCGAPKIGGAENLSTSMVPNVTGSEDVQDGLCTGRPCIHLFWSNNRALITTCSIILSGT